VKQRSKKAYTARHGYRMGTAAMRTLPDFLVIGAQKCGTTFLYQLLTQHPSVRAAFVKEVHYFDLNFEKGEGWYRSQFPLRARRNRSYITGESSPYYMFHPHAARRAAEVVPSAKLISLLRNPTDRAYSHYQHQVEHVRGEGHETLPFEEAIEAEEPRINEQRRQLLRDERHDSVNYRSYSYLSRGIYVDQLAEWSKYFDGSRMLVLKSEELFDDTQGTLKRLLDFLEIPRRTFDMPSSIPNKRQYADMKPETRRRLDAYFEPHNQRLYEYLGSNPSW
jgi:hypothetical protein